MSWRDCKVGDLCKVGRGSSPRPKADQRYFAGGTIPWVKVADATASGKYLFETKERVNQFGASFSRLLPAGSLIICTSGTLGLSVFLGVDGCIHDGWLYTYDYTDLDPEFFYYFLGSKGAYFESQASGAAIQNINTDILRNTPIRLPSLDMQARIAGILKSFDDLIENNRRRIALLEAAARMLYREWFVHFRFPGHEHVKIIDGLPEGWERTTLGRVAETNRASCGAKELPEQINYIDISSVAQGRIVSKTTLSPSEAPGRARRKARDGDVIWSNVRPNLRAYALVLQPDETDVFSTGFTVLTGKSVPFSWLYLIVTTENFVGHLVNHATGAGYPAVRPDDFERSAVVLPSEGLLKHFHEATEPNFRLVSKLEQQNRSLAQARDLLLPRLMNGEIAV